jgi:hypothetical protein
MKANERTKLSLMKVNERTKLPLMNRLKTVSSPFHSRPVPAPPLSLSLALGGSPARTSRPGRGKLGLDAASHVKGPSALARLLFSPPVRVPDPYLTQPRRWTSTGCGGPDLGGGSDHGGEMSLIWIFGF